MTYSYDRRQAAQKLDLADWGLDGLTKGETVTLYHGSTRLFHKFDLSRSRTELVDSYYGTGIFLTPSKRVAERYAEANRNIGFDPAIIDDLKRHNRPAGEFLEHLYREGKDAWDLYTREFFKLGPDDSYSEAFEKYVGGLDPNDISDIAGYVIGSKEQAISLDDGPLDLFGGSTGMPEWIYDTLDKLGVDSKAYRPKVYNVAVRVENPLVTANKSQARSARSKGYDCVVFYGSDLVDGVPEVAVYDPSNAKVRGYEVI